MGEVCQFADASSGDARKGRIKDIAAEPGQTVTSPFLNGIPAVNPSTGDVRIEFYAAIRTPEPFLPAGTVIAREQTYVYTFHKKDAPQQSFLPHSVR